MTEKNVIIAGAFDQMDSRKIRFIHQASKFGKLHIVLFDDALMEKNASSPGKFPLAERRYFVENIRYVANVYPISSIDQLENIVAITDCKMDIWAVLKEDQLSEKFAKIQDIEYRMIDDSELAGFPEHDYDLTQNTNKKVIVTGCFDFFHTGHIRFFEEAGEYGDLYVALGNDKNLELLKGPGHPMFSQDYRKYVAGSIRFVKQAMISTGTGWLDAEPEIKCIKPNIYITNEDGDKEVKRQYCQTNGIEYIVLKRLPKSGLTRRTSTDLRGF